MNSHYLADFPLQLIMPALTTQIRHCHNLDDETRPPGKVLRALSRSSFRVILLPRESSLLPALVDSLHEVLPQVGVQLRCTGFVRAGSLRNVL